MTTPTSPPAAPAAPDTTSPITMGRLRRLNIIAGVFHLVQMILILVLATDFALPVTATYIAGPPGTPASAPVTLFEIGTAVAVALFFGLSALFHFIVAAPGFNRRYVRGLGQGHNYFRWVEYSLSSSVMIILIAQLLGVFDVIALIAIFGVNVSMILFGWLQEKDQQPGGVCSRSGSAASPASCRGWPSWCSSSPRSLPARWRFPVSSGGSSSHCSSCSTASPSCSTCSTSRSDGGGTTCAVNVPTSC